MHLTIFKLCRITDTFWNFKEVIVLFPRFLILLYIFYSNLKISRIVGYFADLKKIFWRISYAWLVVVYVYTAAANAIHLGTGPIQWHAGVRIPHSLLRWPLEGGTAGQLNVMLIGHSQYGCKLTTNKITDWSSSQSYILALVYLLRYMQVAINSVIATYFI